MKRKITIGEKKPHPLYMPKDLIREGFVGETFILANSQTVTIVKPGATLNEIEESLEIILKDVRLRKSSAVNSKAESKK